MDCGKLYYMFRETPVYGVTPCTEITCYAVSPNATNTGHFHDNFYILLIRLFIISLIVLVLGLCDDHRSCVWIPLISVSPIFIKEKHLAKVSKQKCSDT